jgi:hypothetical protein
MPFPNSKLISFKIKADFKLVYGICCNTILIKNEFGNAINSKYSLQIKNITLEVG